MKLLDRLFHFIETLPPSDRLILKILLVCCVVTFLWVVAFISMRFSVEVPEQGGAITEGIIGTPRFINPLLAVSAADKDMSALMYAGLMRLSPEGILVPDLAESLTISDDGLTYNVVLKQDLEFHDGAPLTSDDVLFTISRIQDPSLKSPLRGTWEGVVIEKISDLEFNFVLKQAYAPFIEYLTVGIIPKHIWENATIEELPFSEYNSEPIGSGPYILKSISRNRSGIPDSYTLTPFSNYHGERPHLDKLTLIFYQNENELVAALNEGIVDSAASISSEGIDKIFSAPNADKRHTLYRTPLPRTFAVFFNQNENPLFRDAAVRKALNTAVDRAHIVEEAIGGYGTSINGPLPPGFGFENTNTATGSPLENIENARTILREGGWKINETTGLWEKKDGTDVRQLTFSIATANTPLFETTAEILRNTWSELGIPVDVKKFEQTDLTQTVIRPRKYDALLFGTEVGRELNFYSFWHSSQRNDPGLNVALYASLTTDATLTETRIEKDFEKRRVYYEQFAEEMKEDMPALFLFVPEFTYIAPSNTHNISFKGLAKPSERFSQIETWYKDTENVWTLFTSN